MFEKIIKAGGILFFGFLIIILVFFIHNNRQLKNTLKRLDAQKGKEFDGKLEKERVLIRKDLEEKHAADMVSYQAMAKRVELEKKKVQELEAKLNK